MILPHVLKIIYSRNVELGIIDQCHSETDLVNCMWVSDLYIMVHRFCLNIISIDFKIFHNQKMVPAGDIRNPLGTCSSFYFSESEVSKFFIA